MEKAFIAVGIGLGLIVLLQVFNCFWYWVFSSGIIPTNLITDDKLGADDAEKALAATKNKLDTVKSQATH